MAGAPERAAGRGSNPQGVLALWYDVDPLAEDEFNDWYAREHFPERLSIPGFRRARRFQAVIGAPRYFVVYDVERAETLASQPYLDRLNNPTDWSRRMMPAFRATNRSVCRVIARTAHGTGGWAAAWQARPEVAPKAVESATWLAKDFIPSLAGSKGIVGAQFWIADPKLTQQRTAEAQLRGEPDRVSHWVIVIEATKGDDIDELLDRGLLAEHGVTVEPPAVYRFLHGLGEI